ncbi:hypothetical protein [Sandaracinus amylolyticus]|uniref:hypothetical protein n=1 Tax=Sandaracinus amylolyticus TaxID=927083 RepID=UPI0012ECBDD4|nr:hypothetical protein [Sandaracinus amylolyticus]
MLLVIAGCNPDHIDLDLAPIDAGGNVPEPTRDAGRRDARADAGRDADDAGAGDGGRTCGTIGGCHPLYDASCRCGFDDLTAEWSCGRSGTRREGEDCESAEDCGPGLLCTRSYVVGGGQCRRLCDQDSDCGTGQGCAELGRIASCTGWCIALAECDLVGQTCGAGRGCYWMRDQDAARDHVFCHRAGTEQETRSCLRDPTRCEPGLLCVSRTDGVGSTTRCQPLCTTSDDCPVGSSCGGRTAAGVQFCR